MVIPPEVHLSMYIVANTITSGAQELVVGLTKCNLHIYIMFVKCAVSMSQNFTIFNLADVCVGLEYLLIDSSVDVMRLSVLSRQFK